MCPKCSNSNVVIFAGDVYKAAGTNIWKDAKLDARIERSNTGHNLMSQEPVLAFLKKEIKDGRFKPRSGIPLQVEPLDPHQVTALYGRLISSDS